MRVVRILLFVGMAVALTQVLTGEPAYAAPQAVTMTISNPYCVQDIETTGACWINLRTFYAYTSDSSFSHIEIAIGGKVRAHMTGFFETSAYMTQSMLGKGLMVPCGGKNASGIPDMGLQYAVTLTGFATGSQPLVDVANVTCPYYQGRVYLPLALK